MPALKSAPRRPAKCPVMDFRGANRNLRSVFAKTHASSLAFQSHRQFRWTCRENSRTPLASARCSHRAALFRITRNAPSPPSRGLRNVVRIAGHSVARHFRQNLRAAILRRDRVFRESESRNLRPPRKPSRCASNGRLAARRLVIFATKALSSRANPPMPHRG